MDMQELLKLLACPVCHNGLEAADSGLICQHCRVLYPIRDNIPILLIEEAVPLDKDEGDSKKCES